MKKLPALLIVWDGVPNQQTGSGIILWRLLRNYPLDKLWLLTSTPGSERAADPVPPISNHIRVLQAWIPRRFLDHLAEIANALTLPLIVWRGVREVSRKQIDVLFTVPWSVFFVAAYYIHRFTKRPLHVYVMDDPAGGASYPAWKAFFHRLLMPRILRTAATVWCVSSYTCEEFERLYSVRCRPLWPPVDTEDFRPPGPLAVAESPRRVQIVYTGSIYSAQIDALQNLVRAMNAAHTPSDGIQFELTLYTDHPESSLQRMGLSGPNIRSRRVALSEIPRVLAEADILFLPYTFDARLEHMARTSFPSKIAEYLSAGVPTLVHAPPCATTTRFFREHLCGHVVDSPDVSALREALFTLSTNTQLREQLATRGLEVAKQIFERRTIVAEFEEAISS
jgi:glycosyltransferase involved in cell wall biosynthesis